MTTIKDTAAKAVQDYGAEEYARGYADGLAARTDVHEELLLELEAWIKQRREADQPITDEPEFEVGEEVEAVEQLNAPQPEQDKTVAQRILEHVAEHPGQSARKIKEDLELGSDSSVYRLLYKDKLKKVWLADQKAPGFYLPGHH